MVVTLFTNSSSSSPKRKASNNCIRTRTRLPLFMASFDQGEPSQRSDEDDMTPEERIEYLRAHGIQVELAPSERTATRPTPQAPGSGNVVTFRYVRIPAHEGEPYEELVAEVDAGVDGSGVGGDKLPIIVKPRFAADASNGIKDEASARACDPGALSAPHAGPGAASACQATAGRQRRGRERPRDDGSHHGWLG
jgi:hypothetical protein